MQVQLRAERALLVPIPVELAHNETASISLTCRIVRLVPEGICIDFIHHSRRDLTVVKRFLATVRETPSAIKAKPLKASFARLAHETVVPEAEPVAFPSPALVSSTVRSGETLFLSYGAEATHRPVEPSETAATYVWIRVARDLVKRAWVLVVATLVLTASWMLYRAAAGSSRIPLGLQVLSRGEQIEIHWNHDATTIRKAAKGVMRISDGGVKEVIEFDAKQLRDGVVAYSPTGNDVTIQFEISSVDGARSSESVRSVAIP